MSGKKTLPFRAKKGYRPPEGFGYNALQDEHLSHYITKQHMTDHLIKTGLLTHQGLIRSDNEVNQLWRKREYNDRVARKLGQSILRDTIESRRQEEIRQQDDMEAHRKEEAIRQARLNRSITVDATEEDGTISSAPSQTRKSRAASAGMQRRGMSPSHYRATSPYNAPVWTPTKDVRARNRRTKSATTRREQQRSPVARYTSLYAPPSRQQPYLSQEQPHSNPNIVTDTDDDNDHNDHGDDVFHNDGSLPYSPASSTASTPPTPSVDMDPYHHHQQHHEQQRAPTHRSMSARQNRSKHSTASRGQKHSGRPQSLISRPTLASEHRYGLHHPTQYSTQRFAAIDDANASGNTISERKGKEGSQIKHQSSAFARREQSKKKSQREAANRSAAILSERAAQMKNQNRSVHVRPLSLRRRTQQQPSMTFAFVSKGKKGPAYSYRYFDEKGQLLQVKQQIGASGVLIATKYVQDGDTFQIVSRRRQDQGLGLVFLIDGQLIAKISTCCEYKHKLGTTFGKVSCHIKLADVQHGQPCMRCRIQQQLEDNHQQEHHDAAPNDARHSRTARREHEDESSWVGSPEEDSDSYSHHNDGRQRATERQELNTTKRCEDADTDADADAEQLDLSRLSGSDEEKEEGGTQSEDKPDHSGGSDDEATRDHAIGGREYADDVENDDAAIVEKKPSQEPESDDGGSTSNDSHAEEDDNDGVKNNAKEEEDEYGDDFEDNDDDDDDNDDDDDDGAIDSDGNEDSDDARERNAEDGESDTESNANVAKSADNAEDVVQQQDGKGGDESVDSEGASTTNAVNGANIPMSANDVNDAEKAEAQEITLVSDAATEPAEAIPITRKDLISAVDGQNTRQLSSEEKTQVPTQNDGDGEQQQMAHDGREDSSSADPEYLDELTQDNAPSHMKLKPSPLDEVPPTARRINSHAPEKEEPSIHDGKVSEEAAEDKKLPQSNKREGQAQDPTPPTTENILRRINQARFGLAPSSDDTELSDSKEREEQEDNGKEGNGRDVGEQVSRDGDPSLKQDEKLRTGDEEIKVNDAPDVADEKVDISTRSNSSEKETGEDNGNEGEDEDEDDNSRDTARDEEEDKDAVDMDGDDVGDDQDEDAARDEDEDEDAVDGAAPDAGEDEDEDEDDMEDVSPPESPLPLKSTPSLPSTGNVQKEGIESVTAADDNNDDNDDKDDNAAVETSQSDEGEDAATSDEEDFPPAELKSHPPVMIAMGVLSEPSSKGRGATEEEGEQLEAEAGLEKKGQGDDRDLAQPPSEPESQPESNQAVAKAIPTNDPVPERGVDSPLRKDEEGSVERKDEDVTDGDAKPTSDAADIPSVKNEGTDGDADGDSDGSVEEETSGRRAAVLAQQALSTAGIDGVDDDETGSDTSSVVVKADDAVGIAADSELDADREASDAAKSTGDDASDDASNASSTTSTSSSEDDADSSNKLGAPPEKKGDAAAKSRTTDEGDKENKGGVEEAPKSGSGILPDGPAVYAPPKPRKQPLPPCRALKADGSIRSAMKGSRTASASLPPPSISDATSDSPESKPKVSFNKAVKVRKFTPSKGEHDGAQLHAKDDPRGATPWSPLTNFQLYSNSSFDQLDSAMNSLSKTAAEDDNEQPSLAALSKGLTHKRNRTSVGDGPPPAVAKKEGQEKGALNSSINSNGNVNVSDNSSGNSLKSSAQTDLSALPPL